MTLGGSLSIDISFLCRLAHSEISGGRVMSMDREKSTSAPFFQSLLRSSMVVIICRALWIRSKSDFQDIGAVTLTYFKIKPIVHS